jgi:ribosomal protein L12E/L44/L45/RPP1/RPP2
MLVLQIDELLKQRNEIHASYTVAPPMKRSSSKNKNRGSFKDTKEDDQGKEKRSSNRDRDRPKKKKWYNIPLKVDKRKSC